jgi:cytochrome c
LKSRLAFTQRRAASVPGFGYSKATRKAGAAGLVWGEATLDKFLENPSVFCRAPACATPASRVPKSAHT